MKGYGIPRRIDGDVADIKLYGLPTRVGTTRSGRGSAKQASRRIWKKAARRDARREADSRASD